MVMSCGESPGEEACTAMSPERVRIAGRSGNQEEKEGPLSHNPSV